MHQVFWVGYYNVREANLTQNVLDGQNILGVKLKLSVRTSAYKVSFKIGDIIPADCCLTEAINGSIDQAALTGESLPQSKKLGDQYFL